jgi:hypothetical protein
MRHRPLSESEQQLSGGTEKKALNEGRAVPNYLQLALPLSQTVACVVCGKPFEVRRRRGRPQKFCSDACRDGQRLRQQAEWNIRARSNLDPQQ